MPEWESKLRQACVLIQAVIDESRDTLEDEDQFDNAADDGAMRAMLDHAKSIVMAELPRKEDKA